MQLPSPFTDASSLSPLSSSSSQAETEDSTHSTMNRHTNNKADDDRRKLQHFAASIAKPLSTFQTPFVSHELLQRFRINFFLLDFVTGKPASGKQQFINPMPAAHVEKLLGITQPWLGGGASTDFIPDTTWNDACGEAQHFYNVIKRYLRSVKTGDLKQKSLLAHTPWNPFSNNYKMLRQYGKESWEAEDIFRYCTSDEAGSPIVMPNVPHMTTFVASGIRLREGEISHPEMMTILWLAILYAMDRLPVVPHKYIPVTVVSGSWRSARIVQGVVDFREARVEIRMSPIINFEKGVRNDKNWPMFLTLLGWFAGQPVGLTT